MKAAIPLLKCNKCNKEYKSDTAYNKHKLLCCDVYNSILPIENKLQQKELSLDEALELCKMPSELMRSVQALIKSNHKLREEVEELKKCNKQAQNKKIVVIEWLNKNYKPTHNYKKFMKNLVIERSQLEIIFNSNFVLGVEEILQDYLGSCSEKTVPFKSFTQKNNILYAFTDENKWERLTPEDFNSILLTISKDLLTEFTKWQNENEDRLYTEDFSVIYLQNVKKVLGGNKDIEKSQRQIYRNFYQYLKKDFQSIVQYDFA